MYHIYSRLPDLTQYRMLATIQSNLDMFQNLYPHETLLQGLQYAEGAWYPVILFNFDNDVTLSSLAYNDRVIKLQAHEA